MAKRSTKSIKRRASGKQTIDYSDIPELTAAQMKKAKRARVGRPTLGLAARKSISIKIDPILLFSLRVLAQSKAMPYQSLMHKILEDYVLREKRH